MSNVKRWWETMPAMLGGIAAIIVAVGGLLTALTNVLPDRAEDVGRSFTVLSVDHSNGSVGQYFNFDVQRLDSILGSRTWKEEVIQVKNERTSRAGEAKVWRKASGGSVGDGHGRWNVESRAGQWETGDVVTVR